MQPTIIPDFFIHLLTEPADPVVGVMETDLA